MTAQLHDHNTRQCPQCLGTGRHRLARCEEARLLARGRTAPLCSICDGDKTVPRVLPGPEAVEHPRCLFVYRNGRSCEAILPRASLPEFSAKLTYGSKQAGTGLFRFSRIEEDGALLYRECVVLRLITASL